MPSATEYILYYAPFPEQAPVGSLDVDSLVSLSGVLESGTSLYVAVQPYDDQGPINVFSNAPVMQIREANGS